MKLPVKAGTVIWQFFFEKKKIILKKMKKTSLNQKISLKKQANFSIIKLIYTNFVEKENEGS